MKVNKPTVVQVEYDCTLEGQLKLAELVGRVSHASENNITPTSYKSFINRMLKMKHLSVLEFCQVVLDVTEWMYEKITTGKYNELLGQLLANNYSNLVQVDNKGFYIFTNLRVLAEISKSETLDELLDTYKDYIVEDIREDKLERCTFRIDTSIGVAQQINRHRANSVLQRSTRYCNYSKDRFGSEISFTEPQWHSFDNIDNKEEAIKVWKEAMSNAEKAYMKLIDLGLKAEEARGVLPLDTSTALYHCTSKENWEHFIHLRSAKSAHPDTRFISDEIKYLLDN